MQVLWMILLFLLLISLSLAAFACFAKALPKGKSKLIPFAVLPVPDGSPAARAFLERYAGQIAWMDSEILRCVFLVYPDDSPDAEILCTDMHRQYDFFSPVSLTEMLKILKQKTSETCCNFEKNTV